MHNKFNSYFFVFLGAIILSSCASRTDVVYFQDVSNFETQVNTNTFVSKFKVDDLVSINVSSLNPEASSPFNLVEGTIEGSGAIAQRVDYLVDEAGEIDFPVIGKIKIQGLSPEELRILLRDKLSDYLKDPIINIRLRNFTVTVLGAVNAPGTYPVDGEQITILEALGLAGDMSITGIRENVLVVRDFEGTKVYTRINLLSKNIMKSPVYYLTQNDVIYVEPNKAGVNASALSTDAKAGIAVTIISVLITSAVIIATNN